MMKALSKVVYSILESKYENKKNVNRRKKLEIKKGEQWKLEEKRQSYDDDDLL